MDKVETTDGHEAIIGKTYYTIAGQEVSLDIHAKTGDKDMFMVTPYYTGETMTVSCDSGSHSEHTADYEHEGDPILVDSIFVDPPIVKLSKKYNDFLSKLENLAISVGVIEKAKNKIDNQHTAVVVELKRKGLDLKILNNKIAEANQSIKCIEEEVAVKKKTLATLEDSLSTVNKGDENAAHIDKECLHQLRMDQCELNCLKAGGVDNWEWYSESLSDHGFFKRYPGD